MCSSAGAAPIRRWRLCEITWAMPLNPTLIKTDCLAVVHVRTGRKGAFWCMAPIRSRFGLMTRGKAQRQRQKRKTDALCVWGIGFLSKSTGLESINHPHPPDLSPGPLHHQFLLLPNKCPRWSEYTALRSPQTGYETKHFKIYCGNYTLILRTSILFVLRATEREDVLVFCFFFPPHVKFKLGNRQPL